MYLSSGSTHVRKAVVAFLSLGKGEKHGQIRSKKFDWEQNRLRGPSWPISRAKSVDLGLGGGYRFPSGRLGEKRKKCLNYRPNP